MNRIFLFCFILLLLSITSQFYLYCTANATYRRPQVGDIIFVNGVFDKVYPNGTIKLVARAKKDRIYYSKHGSFRIFDIKGVNDDLAMKMLRSFAEQGSGKTPSVNVKIEVTETIGSVIKGKFVEWGGDFKTSLEIAKEEHRHKEEERAAIDAENLRKEKERKRKEALERAKKAEREAKEAEERKKKIEQELEAQPPRLLVGKVDNFNSSEHILVLKVQDLTYRIKKSKDLSFYKGELVKLVVRRVDSIKSNILVCDFVSYEQEFLKEHNRLLIKNKIKKEELENQIVIKDKEIVELEQKANNEMNKLVKYEDDITVFQITGKVLDREPDAVQIWGIAIPINGNRTHWARQFEKTNIAVLNPKPLRNPTYYHGNHYFLGKTTSKNAFGASVPLWVFGGMKKDIKTKVKPIIEKYSKLRDRITKFKSERKEINDKLSKFETE